MPELDVKWQYLNNILAGMGRVAVAYSGGVDSNFLLAAAVKVLGPGNVLAVTIDSPLGTSAEAERVVEYAREIGAELVQIPGTELEQPSIRDNPADRCYYCKRYRFQLLRDLVAARGFTVLLDGSNLDDDPATRPGMRAGVELGVRSPLREAGFSKADVRAASAQLGLPSATLPSFACLASRIPHGTPLSLEQLRRIERGEELLQTLGLHQYRLRDHGDTARIEVDPSNFATVVAAAPRLAPALRELGYRYVTLDLDGFRTGRMSEGAV